LSRVLLVSAWVSFYASLAGRAGLSTGARTRDRVTRSPYGDSPAFPSGVSFGVLTHNRNEKENDMKTCRLPYAEDVPHCAAAETQGMDTFDAITQTQILDLTVVPTDPDWPNAVSRRIVQVTDEDENIVPEFISIDKILSFKR